MVQARQVDALISGLVDRSGNRLSAGKVYFYETDGVTLASIWEDDNKIHTATNPVTLDDQGCATVFGDQTYNVVIKDSDGNTIGTPDGLTWDIVDNSLDKIVATQFGSPSNGYDTIQAAIDYAAGENRTVYLGSYNWIINSHLTTPSNINLEFEYGGYLSSANSSNITFDGTVSSPPFPICDSSLGTVTFGNRIPYVPTVWTKGGSALGNLFFDSVTIGNTVISSGLITTSTGNLALNPASTYSVTTNAPIMGIKSDASSYDLTWKNTHASGISRLILQNNNTNTNAQFVSDDALSRIYIGSSSGSNNFLYGYTGSSGRWQFNIDSTEIARFYKTGIDFSQNLGIGISAFSSTTIYANRTGSVDSNALYGRNILNGNNTIGIAVRGEATTTGTPDSQTIYGGYFDAYNGGGATTLTAYSLYTHRGDVFLNGSSGNTYIGLNSESSTKLQSYVSSGNSFTAFAAKNLQNGNNTTGVALKGIASTAGSPDTLTIYGAYLDAFNGGSATNLTAYALYTNRGDVRFNTGGGSARFDSTVIVYGTYVAGYSFKINNLTHSGVGARFEAIDYWNLTASQSAPVYCTSEITPIISASGAFTWQDYAYLKIGQMTVNSGTITNKFLMYLNAALGTHVATTNSDKTANAKPGTLKVNVNGTLYHIQLYSDT